MSECGLGLENFEARLLFLTLLALPSLFMTLFRNDWLRRERHRQRIFRVWIIEQIHAEDLQKDRFADKLPTPNCPCCQHCLAHELRWLQDTGHIIQGEDGVYRLTDNGERQRTSKQPSPDFSQADWVRLDDHIHPPL